MNSCATRACAPNIKTTRLSLHSRPRVFSQAPAATPTYNYISANTRRPFIHPVHTSTRLPTPASTPMAHRQSISRAKAQSQPLIPQQQQQQPTGIGYPILKTGDIVDCLQELHVPIQEEDINRPNPQSIQTAWAILLESFNGVTIEGFERPKGALLGMMQYPVRRYTSSST